MIKFLWWELNLEELFIGACVQFPLYYIIGWWVLLLMPLCGLLWAIGGSKEGIKAVRRFGVPLLCAVFIYFTFGFSIPLGVACVLTALVLSMGYGENSVFYKLYGFIPEGIPRTFAIRTTTYILYFLCYLAAVPFVRR